MDGRPPPEMQIVDSEEGELFIRSLCADKRAGPKAKCEQSGRAQPEHLATG